MGLQTKQTFNILIILHFDRCLALICDWLGANTLPTR
jgi:hypothetical protein